VEANIQSLILFIVQRLEEGKVKEAAMLSVLSAGEDSDGGEQGGVNSLELLVNGGDKTLQSPKALAVLKMFSMDMVYPALLQMRFAPWWTV